MKKNILSVVILAAIIVDITLSAIILFAVVPKAQKTDSLIQKIVTVLDLELENPDAAKYMNVPVEDQVEVALTESVTVTLRAGDDKKTHYALIQVTLVLNKGSADYDKKSQLVSSTTRAVMNYVDEEASKYTNTEIIDCKDIICKSVLADLRTYYDSSDLVCNVLLQIKVQ